MRVDLTSWAAGALLALLVMAGIAVGSGGLSRFDAELTFYAVGSVSAAFAVGYRFAAWAQRPPTRMYLTRGVQLLLRRRWGGSGGPGGIRLRRPAPTAAVAVADRMIAQNFIRRRGAYRWIMHLCLSGGCTLAFAVTFPLVFGWVHFAPLAGDAEVYRVTVLGVPMDRFEVHSLKGFVLFNMLNIAGVVVLVGLILAGIRRWTDAGERATQTFYEDILPLVLIFAVTVTGLALTVSYKFMEGRGHHLWAVIHLVSVLTLLFYIPFGKLFHLFQRICSVCVSLYRTAGEQGPRAYCVRCGEDFSSAMQVEDLKTVLDQLGFDYRFTTPLGTVHYQDICPSCRRKLVALNQGGGLGR